MADASEMVILGRSSRNGHQHERRTARHNCANSRISFRVTLSLPTDQTVRYGFVSTVLKRHRYFKRTKGQRGVLFAYLQRLNGYTRQRLTRLIARSRHERSLAPLSRASRTSRTSFGHRDGPDEVKLLAEVDSLHDTLSGPATKVILMSAWQTFGMDQFIHLSGMQSQTYTTCAPAIAIRGRVHSA